MGKQSSFFNNNLKLHSMIVNIHISLLNVLYKEQSLWNKLYYN